MLIGAGYLRHCCPIAGWKERAGSQSVWQECAATKCQKAGVGAPGICHIAGIVAQDRISHGRDVLLNEQLLILTLFCKGLNEPQGGLLHGPHELHM